MDVSLDDYISKSNFKVKIGNANPNTGGFQQGKKKFGGNFQGNRVTDVSVTVPAVRKTGVNGGKTNQVRDARERLVEKNKPRDARDKLNMKVQMQPNADARQKLMNIRARKVPAPGDARAKIEAKKQGQGQAPGPSGPSGRNFTVTRTVNNQSGVQLTSGPPGNMQITRTLTKVMPPGYESLLGPSTSNATQTPQTSTPAPPSVKTRLGPPQRPANAPVVNLTRTVSNPSVQAMPQQPGPPQYPPPPQQPPIVHPYPHPGGAPFQHVQPPAPPYYPHNQAPHPPHHPGYAGPPSQYPPPAQYPPILQQAPPPAQQAPPIMHHQPAVSRFVPPYPVEESVQRTMVQSIPVQHPPQSPVQPPPQSPPVDRPPYPVDDNVPITRTIGQEVPHLSSKAPLPVIQVRNDQYRPPEQQPYPQYTPSQAYRPPEPQQYRPPEPQYTYSQPEQPAYHASSQSQSVFHRTVPNTSSSPSGFVKTVVNDVPSPRQSSPLKRKAESGGPLRLSNTNTTPVIDLPGGGARGSSQSSGFSYSRSSAEEPVVKRTKQEVSDESDVMSPLQGYKVVISNLHVTVTQDDIIELFGAMGAVKKVRVVKPGSAEVTYVKKESAVEAVKTYNERELDGQPMVVKMGTSMSARVKDVPETLPASVKPVATGPLKLSKKPAGMSRVSDKKGVEVDVLHKALFKTGSITPSKPVTFTVNI